MDSNFRNPNIFVTNYKQAGKTKSQRVVIPDEVEHERLYNIKKDIDKWGPSDRCPGCEAIIRGTAKAPHTAICRVRIEAELVKTEEGGQRLARADERMAHEIVRRAGTDPY